MDRKYGRSDNDMFLLRRSENWNLIIYGRDVVFFIYKFFKNVKSFF